MMLINNKIENKILFEENIINLIIIENKCFFRQFIEMLIQQTEGKFGDFVLSHKNKEILIKDKACIIDNPICVNINEKRIIAKLYKLYEKSFLDSDLIINYNNILSQIELLISEVLDFYDYDAVFQPEIDFNQLLKLTNTKLNEDKSDSLMKLYDYLKIISQLNLFEIIIFINLSSFFTECEIQQLYEFCCYNKLNIMIIESHDRKLLKYEKKLIIDNDLCEIIVK